MWFFYTEYPKPLCRYSIGNIMYPNAAYVYSQLNTGHPNVRYRFLQTHTEYSDRGNGFPEACLENLQVRAGYSNQGNEIPEACLGISKSTYGLAIHNAAYSINKSTSIIIFRTRYCGNHAYRLAPDNYSNGKYTIWSRYSSRRLAPPTRNSSSTIKPVFNGIGVTKMPGTCRPPAT